VIHMAIILGTLAFFACLIPFLKGVEYSIICYNGRLFYFAEDSIEVIPYER